MSLLYEKKNKRLQFNELIIR